MKPPTDFLTRIEGTAGSDKGPDLPALIYARRVNPESFADAWGRYDRADWLLGLAWSFDVSLDPRTLVRFASECSDRALSILTPPWSPLSPQFEEMVRVTHRWIEGTSRMGEMQDVRQKFSRLVELVALPPYSRGVFAALASAYAAHLCALTATEGICGLGGVDRKMYVFLAAAAATYGMFAALDMLAEQRWQAERLRELFTVRDCSSGGAAAMGLRA